MELLQVTLNSLVIVTYVLLSGAGLFLVRMVSDLDHFALGGVMLGSAYFYYILFQAGVPPFVAFIAAILFGGFLGAVSYWLLKSFIDRDLVLISLITTVLLWLGMEAIVAILFGNDGKFLTDGVLSTVKVWGDVAVTKVGVNAIIFMVLATAASWFVIERLGIGRQLRAVSQNPSCAEAIGVNVNRVRLLVFTISGMLAGSVGLIFMMNRVATPKAALFPIIAGTVIMFCGGVQHFKGLVLAAILITFSSEMLIGYPFENFSFQSSWAYMMMFAIAFIILMIKPKGLFSFNSRR